METTATGGARPSDWIVTPTQREPPDERPPSPLDVAIEVLQRRRPIAQVLRIE